MGLLSGAGRIFFASYFLFSAWQQFNAFGLDGGPTARAFRPMFDNLIELVTSDLGVPVPSLDFKHVIAAGIALKGFGGTLFIFGSTVGAYLLLLHLATAIPFSHNFYSYGKPEFLGSFVKFTEDLALVGAILFFIEMKCSIKKRHSRKRPPKAKAA